MLRSFHRAAFRQVKENRAGNTYWYFQEIFRRIGGTPPVKTYRGSTPLSLCVPFFYYSIMQRVAKWK